MDLRTSLQKNIEKLKGLLSRERDGNLENPHKEYFDKHLKCFSKKTNLLKHNDTIKETMILSG